MVHATDKNERKNENTVPQPEPLVKFVNTQMNDCLLGVRIRRAMHMEREASMFIGANQITISWRVLVVREQMMPKIMRRAMDRRTICRAVLCELEEVIHSRDNYLRGV